MNPQEWRIFGFTHNGPGMLDLLLVLGPTHVCNLGKQNSRNRI